MRRGEVGHDPVMRQGSAADEARVDDPDIPRQTFDSSKAPPEEGYEGWRGIASPLFDIEAVAPDRPFHAAYQAFHLGSILIGAGSFDPTRFSRSRPRIRRDGLDHLLIQLYTAGGYVGELGPRPVDMPAGRLACLDLTRELSTVSRSSFNISLVIPRDAIPARNVPHGHLEQDGRDKVVCGLLADHMVALVRHLPTLRQSAAGHVAEATLALCRAALVPTADALEAASEPIHDALLMRARRLVEKRLTDEGLSVESLAAELRVSRSTLYRLFEPFGGVAAYVLDRRMVRARAALRDPANMRRIGEIALACGFSDASHFSRAFRRRFGMTPAEARREGTREAPRGGMTERADLGPWINTLS